MTRVADAKIAATAGVDAIGLNFYPPSPRAVDTVVAARIADSLPALIQIVGVFVDPNRQDVESVLDQVNLSLLQFHGSESADFCRSFSVPYIKALRMSEAANPDAYARTYPDARALLLDAYEADRYGGTGTAFAWERAAECRSRPVVIAGGITAENASAALTESGAYAVDVSTGVESGPGLKSAEKIHELVRAVREHDQASMKDATP